MAESYPEAEMVLDDELVFDEPSRRRSTLVRRDDRPEGIVREGEVLAGKYRVERIPGRSGLGIVVQVRHVDLGQEVTLKFLVPEACAYPEFVQRFVREARSAVKIQGEHVARVTDVGRLESGAPYMVREFLRGPDLSEVLKVRGRLPVSEAVDYIIQACEGVAEGHALGVVHRNLRPTTLIITRRSDGTPLVKVIDFAAGESLHMNPFTERAVSLVGTSAIMSSLPYMAPEQVRDPQDVDARADVYALGAILHELLTGTPVYQADSAPALLAAVAADGAPPVRALRVDAPGELDHIVLRCLSKNRALRYSSMGELATSLAPFGSSNSAGLVERISFLSRQNSALVDGKAGSSVLAPRSSVRPVGPHGTIMMMPAVQPRPPSMPPMPSVPPLPIVADDVTVMQPLHQYQPLMQEQSLLRTPQPPRLRQSSPPPPPPPRRSEPPALPVNYSVEPELSSAGAGNTSRYAPPHVPPSVSQTRPTVMPPRHSSSLPGGVVRSWAPSEDDTVVVGARRRRMMGVAAVAAFATLGIILGLRSGSANLGAAAAAQPAAVAPLAPPAPAPVAPAPAPPPAEVAPVQSAVALASASAAAAVAPPAAPAPVAAAPVAAAPRPAPRLTTKNDSAAAASRPQEVVAAAPAEPKKQRDLFASPD
jgi:serine/threonine-protein kinase